MSKRLFRPARVTDSVPRYPTRDEFEPRRRAFLRQVGAACMGVGLGLLSVGETEAAPKAETRTEEDKKKPDEDKKKPIKKQPPSPTLGRRAAPRAAIDDEEFGD